MRKVGGHLPPASGGRALWFTLAVLLALGAFTHWADRPPAPQPANAPGEVFSAQRAAGVLKELVGTGTPHPLASAADATIRAQIVQHLNALGIATELQEGWACDTSLACGRAVNIIGRIEGRSLRARACCWLRTTIRCRQDPEPATMASVSPRCLRSHACSNNSPRGATQSSC